MALIALSDDELRSIFGRLCNPLRPFDAMDFGSANHGLWLLTKALREELKEWHESVAALGRKVCPTAPHQSEWWWRRMLREATEAMWVNAGLTATDLTTLATLGSVLPALETLRLHDPSGSAGPDGVQRLAEGLGAGALPAMTDLRIVATHVGDAGASALAAALGQGALPRLKILQLNYAAIGDAGLVALAPALRRLPALERLDLF